jgi:hypothetical protein
MSVDGPLKVSGRATYAYEQWEAGQLLYGFIVGATIGEGRITGIDASRAERSPGDDDDLSPKRGTGSTLSRGRGKSHVRVRARPRFLPKVTL